MFLGNMPIIFYQIGIIAGLPMYICWLLLIIILFLVKYHWSRRKLYAAASKMEGPRGLPLIGNALLFHCNSKDILHRISSVFDLIGKEPGRFWLGPYLMIGLKNPVHLEKIMSSPKFAYKHDLYEILERFVGDGLISASGLKRKYKIHRRILQPMFDLKFVSSIVSMIQKQTDLCMEKLEIYVDKDTFNIHDVIICCALDIIGEAVLGQKMDSQQKGLSKFSRILLQMTEIGFTRMVKVWLHFDFIFNRLPLKKKSDEIIAITHEFVEEALNDSWKRRKLLEREEDKDFVPIIDKLSDFVENNQEVINHEDLVDHLLTFVHASADTFASVSSFAAVCFGMYPEYQETPCVLPGNIKENILGINGPLAEHFSSYSYSSELNVNGIEKAAEEIRSIIGDQPKDLTLEDLYRMEYLEMCVKDVLRLFPIAPYILRKIVEDYTLDKWVLPKEAAIVVPIFNLHRDPAYWDNPEHFHPDHFLPEAVKKRHIYAYLPFSAGPRGCIGKTLANVLLKVFLANLLQRFEIFADGKVPDIELYCDISVRPRKGYNCRLRKREWTHL